MLQKLDIIVYLLFYVFSSGVGKNATIGPAPLDPYILVVLATCVMVPLSATVTIRVDPFAVTYTALEYGLTII